MNTTQLKRFAAEARNKLREGVKGRLIRLGFDLKTGEVPENLRPVAVENAGVWRGKAVSNNFMYNWNELYNHIKQIGIKQMIEEGAYTWFNRFVAIRILAKNNLCDAVLQYVDSARTPRIVDEARQKLTYSEYLIVNNGDGEGQHSVLNLNLFGQTYKLYDINYKLFEEDTLVTEQFAVLINAWVNNNPIISTCFDADSKHFMELLLPDDIRNEGGFLDMLNSADFISDEDYRSPELIGWLYQFYISERKDEVFAKKGKYDADEIAPATQIFTPNWIVKYMVQNTVGRIYLTGREVTPDLQRLAEKWKYLVEPSDSEKEDKSVLPPSELEDLKVADLACGSGHILNECFDLLYELYIHEGYSRREAITNIFEHNLTGIDIDLRAKQLATFALLLKACQRDSSFADAHCLPKILEAPQPFSSTYFGKHNVRGYFPHFFLGNSTPTMFDELEECFKLMEDAKTLGSIIKFPLSPVNREALLQQVEKWESEPEISPGIQIGLPYMHFILALTEKYDVMVANPPYMGGKMPDELNSYAKANYPLSKYDLFAMFIELMMAHTKASGRIGCITMESWMFLSSFENLRIKILDEVSISSMLHMPYIGKGGTSLGINFGNVAFIIKKIHDTNALGDYQCIRYYETDEKGVPLNFPTINERKSIKKQLCFEQIPGHMIGYWISDQMISLFTESKVADSLVTREGMATADNDRFLRLWHEISILKFSKFCTLSDKWYPYNKGGIFRKWYGNRDYVVDWANDGFEIRHNIDPQTGRIRSHNYNGEYAFRESITWSALCSGNISLRYCEEGFLWDSKGASGFSNYDLFYPLGLVNSCVANSYLKLLSPTLDFKVGDIIKIPLIRKTETEIDAVVKECISISRADWDAHETSWDFQGNEIVGLNTDQKYMDLVYGIYEGTGIDVDLAAPQFDSLEWRTELIKAKWTNKFERLHANEEELNRRFIEIYGLQDELTPDVPLNEVTILQQGEISIWKDGDPIPREVKNGTVEFSPIVWHDDVLMKQLISYAVGCMMGRYRLDRPGLAVAHPDPTPEELVDYNLYLIVNKGFADEATTKFINEHESEATLQPDGTYKLYDISYKLIDRFAIDDDAIIPLMPADCGFYDNATQRMSDFVRQVFGADTQTENLNYIERCLGKSIEQYFIKDFWKDHKKMYQNRPIYWLFSSKKGAFQVITYMHRMTPYTVERIRAKYLLPYIETLTNRITELQTREDALSTAESKRLDSLQKQLEECREYHDRLAVVAEKAIGFDLDDGVIHNYALYGDILAKLK